MTFPSWSIESKSHLNSFWERGSQYVSQLHLSEDEFTHSTPFSHINNTFAMMIWIDVYTQPKNIVTELLGQKKVVPKILRPRTYWHQQFETSTGDKTHTDHILPGGETFVLARWEIKQIFRKPETNIKQMSSKKQTNIAQHIFKKKHTQFCGSLKPCKRKRVRSASWSPW